MSNLSQNAGGRLTGLKVLIKGAGEMASGVAYRLHQAGLNVVLTETHRPLAVRRAVSFCEAVYDGTKQVEGLIAEMADGPQMWEKTWAAGRLPLIIDPDLKCLDELKPVVIVDALLAKRNTGLSKEMAELTIGLGPGFKAPDDVHLAIETNRGHNLGRLLYQGQPEANTGVPGDIAGFTHQRVFRAPAQGVFETSHSLGDDVAEGEVIATVGDEPIEAKVSGIIRGLLRPGTPVTKGMKAGDVDPRGQIQYLNTISEKARAIGGSVLEGIMHAFNRQPRRS